MTRIDTSVGNEGNMMCGRITVAMKGRGTHGFRGVEVTEDGSEVIVFGQHTGTMTLKNTTGSTLCKRECLYGCPARPKRSTGRGCGREAWGNLRHDLSWLIGLSWSVCRVRLE